MAKPGAPTHEIGYLSDVYGMSVSYVDTLELVADLTWPLSVRTYNTMRHDPQLTAVMNAYTLPLRQAPKWVDPSGCRDEVVQQIADDLGLPILGVDDKPGPARRRGFNFDDHFRIALLHLIYGHMPFEETYEIKDGRVRLAKLAERMPQTIRDIRLDDNGGLRGVQQNFSDTIIPSSRLTWYSHDREGAMYQGRSMLRPAYGAWLLKHEAWRIMATSGRRFGMGVPSVTAPAGATPAMVSEASRLATQMRAGDESGVGLPPGYTLAITGMTGSSPDMLGFIRYLDSQIAQMALASVLNLDASPNGSRALGDVLVNLMLLSLNSIGGEMGSVLDKLTVRMVDYNWGEDEPAPRIVIGDAGSRPEVTSTSLMELVRYGALVPDPALDAYIRERWQLPERVTSDPAQGTADVPATSTDAPSTPGVKTPGTKTPGSQDPGTQNPKDGAAPANDQNG
jgi:hypothetical protein